MADTDTVKDTADFADAVQRTIEDPATPRATRATLADRVSYIAARTALLRCNKDAHVRALLEYVAFKALFNPRDRHFVLADAANPKVQVRAGCSFAKRAVSQYMAERARVSIWRMGDC